MTDLPKTILVASDGSPESRKAITYGGALAKAVGAKLHLVHVGLISHFTNPDNMNPSQLARLKADAQKRLDDEVAWATSEGVTFDQTHLRMGRVDGEIIRASEEMNADLIAIGNRGMGAITRILLGSDAESVVRHAPCDVVVLRAD